MLHLSSERLAELADSEPTVAEAEHLAACAICATERRAHRRLLTLASDERGRVAAPLTHWPMLSAKLRHEGIIADGVTVPVTTETSVVPITRPRPHRQAWLAGLRFAAGLVFAVGFGALGRVSAGASPVPTGTDMVRVAKAVVGDSTITRPIQNLMDQSSPFSNVEEALSALETSQRNYDRAVAFIAAHDTTSQSPEAGDVFRTRLAALDEMAETSRQALAAAPADQVLNQYYISTLGARDVTLRQLGSVLTPGKRLSRF